MRERWTNIHAWQARGTCARPRTIARPRPAEFGVPELVAQRHACRDERVHETLICGTGSQRQPVISAGDDATLIPFNPDAPAPPEPPPPTDGSATFTLNHATVDPQQAVDPTYKCGDISLGLRKEMPAYTAARSAFHSSLADIVLALGATYKLVPYAPINGEATMAVIAATTPIVILKYLAYQFESSRVGFYATMFNLQDCLSRDWNQSPNLLSPTPTGAAAGGGPAMPGAFGAPVGLSGAGGLLNHGFVNACGVTHITYDHPMAVETLVWCN